ncbi:helix-turn-helix domain-containing protein [Paenibacillus sp. GCM10027626]|uniref:helix-turn-helix domain-containing protein n=1 Tax=Paenibacillus sp. GCM10027626 TaxID=3273411 RepID=UPI003641DE36
MRKTWFNRLLLSYMPVFIFVVTFIFFVFFQVFSEQSRKEAIKSNEMLSLQAMQLIDTSLKAIDTTVLREIAASEDLRSFFKSRQGDDPYIAIRAVNKMKDMMSYNPLIDSLYLVRYADNFVLSNATQSAAGQFSDSQFIEQIRHASPPRWTDTRLFQSFSHLPAKQVVSLVREAHFSSDIQGVIVVNVAANSLRRMTQDLFTSQVSFIQVKDRDEELLFANGMDAVGKTPQSSFVSSYSGWQYESGFIQGGLMRTISYFSNIWFFVGFIMIGLGLIWMVFVTRRHSKPIEQIVDRFSSYTLPIATSSDKGRMDEFAFISSALDDIMAQSLQYQKQYREDMHLRARHLFHQLIDGDAIVSNEEWRREAEKLQLPVPDCSAYRVIIVELDKYGDFCAQYARNDQNLLKFAVRTVTQELFMKHECKSWSEWTAPAQLAAVLFEAEEELLAEEKLSFIADQIRAWIEENLKITITLGVGERAADSDEIPQSFQSAKHMLKYKYALGENRIISSADLATAGQAEAYGHLGDIRELIQLIRKADEGWKAAYHQFFHKLQQGMLANDEIDHLLDYLIYNLNRECALMNKELSSMWSETTRPALNEMLESGYTLVHLQEEMYKVLLPLADMITELQQTSQHGATIREMTAFIEQEFANPKMSLDYLSEQFNINPKYVSKLYKENTGQKFVDFLIDIRMKEARRLLANTAHSIQEISEMVGYTNAISFGRVFKKVMGASPSEYRADAVNKQD